MTWQAGVQSLQINRAQGHQKSGWLVAKRTKNQNQLNTNQNRISDSNETWQHGLTATA
jgi:hypothetical protein